ncbi:cysteine hydrolase family protein [Pseudoflavonifractor sp. MSJ-37]|uniref:cysteine hydrolase family protein n=1 Tax=Pseudoflavonifractor sp. MSJ-37 TaxID=2841531 RepID=UPI001C109D1E|nr:isochorismatase family cysteine hydrolase [Pseudoflavonifractor sp. MSJ-37]MBU5436055.1 cysteine hydrolase [Pseudoflavonifractor sp. MSJ-37]
MKKLLIVVDYQKDFVDGALGFPGAERLDSLIAQRIADYRAAGDDVAFTYDTHGSDYAHTQEGRKLPPAHCLFGTPGWELYGETGAAHLPGDPVFRKPTFPSLELAEWLKGRSYAQVELCGLVSHICVLTNAVMVKAALPETEILVDARLTASYDPALHEKALDVLEGIQITVTHR